MSAFRKLKNLFYILLFINLVAFFKICDLIEPAIIPAFLSNEDNCLRTV